MPKRTFSQNVIIWTLDCVFGKIFLDARVIKSKVVSKNIYKLR